MRARAGFGRRGRRESGAGSAHPSAIKTRPSLRPGRRRRRPACAGIAGLAGAARRPARSPAGRECRARHDKGARAPTSGRERESVDTGGRCCCFWRLRGLLGSPAPGVSAQLFSHSGRKGRSLGRANESPLPRAAHRSIGLRPNGQLVGWSRVGALAERGRPSSRALQRESARAAPERVCEVCSGGLAGWLAANQPADLFGGNLRAWRTCGRPD